MTATLHPQLQSIADEFTAAQARLHRLVEAVPTARWAERADPQRWSAAECVAHLNLTAVAYREPIAAALALGGADVEPRRRYRRGLAGWLLWHMMGPPVRFRVKTASPFVPGATAPTDDLVAEFDRLQEEQLQWVRAANGLRIDRLQVVSPFNSRMRYNLYTALSILPPHQHRHLWQAERVWQSLGGAEVPIPTQSAS
jgi:hypothetical protein